MAGREKTRDEDEGRGVREDDEDTRVRRRDDKICPLNKGKSKTHTYIRYRERGKHEKWSKPELGSMRYFRDRG